MSRVLAWDGCVNVRDLGGLPTEDGGVTRLGSVVRSDDPGRLTDEGRAELVAHGIRTVLDLRAAEELGDEPPREAPVDVVRIALMGERDGDYLRELAERGATFQEWYLDTLERHREPIARALAAIADAPPGGVLVHCVGGKDRTGIVAALLLRLACVPVGAVADDYAAGEGEAPREAMLDVLAELDRRWGGAEAYLRGAGLGEAQLTRLRERLR
ncbi:MAG TPA: tyrosine-protein phosphatase [Gaiellaceae bacterium]|nr:tyrosine-protein phosphatase [Gaiellaceae bacterium]